MSDGKSILWKPLKNEWEVGGLKYHFQFLEQYKNIDSLEFGFLKIRRFFNMAEKRNIAYERDRKSKNKIFAQKIVHLKYIVLGDEINSKWSSGISPTIKYKLQIL